MKIVFHHDLTVIGKIHSHRAVIAHYYSVEVIWTCITQTNKLLVSTSKAILTALTLSDFLRAFAGENCCWLRHFRFVRFITLPEMTLNIYISLERI